MKALLAECVTVDEAKDVRDQAVAVATYYRQRADSLEIQNQAAEIRLRAERRLGELLRVMPKNEGGRPSKTGAREEPVSTLGEIGITNKQSSMWQRIAALADEEFEDRIATAQENGLELTTSRVLGLAKKVAERERDREQESKPAEPPSPPASLRAPRVEAGELCRRATPEWWERFQEIVAHMAPAAAEEDAA